MRLSDKRDGVANDRQGPETEEVHFQKPQLFQRSHGELRGNDGIIDLQGDHLRKRHAGNNNTCRMRGAVTWETFEPERQIDHLFHGFIGLIEAPEIRGDLHGTLQCHVQLGRDGL